MSLLLNIEYWLHRAPLAPPSSTVLLHPPTMERGERTRGRSPRTRAPSVLAMAAVVSIFSGSVLGALGRTEGLEAQRPRAGGLAPQHRRPKRGWNWKQLIVPEEDPTLRVIGQLNSDYKPGESLVRYILSGEGAGDVFEIDEYTGEIRTRRKLDREEKAFYVLQAQAISRGTGEPVEPQSEFIIKVQDINDNAPRFQNEPYVSSIPEMSPKGTIVAQVTATDADDPLFGNNAKLIYSILQGEPYFSVEPKTGIIMTSWPSMDREARDQYLVVVQVKDMLGLSGGHSSSTTITVSLSDVNDNGPTFQHHLYTFGVREDAAVGTTVGRVKADDGDVGVNARMKYSLQDLEESGTFRIQLDPLTEEGMVVLAKPLDYESKSRFVLAVEADNEFVDTRFLAYDEFNDRTTLKIFVENVDEPPVFLAAIYRWKVPESAGVGTVVGAVSARDTDSVNNPIRYSIESRGSDIRKAFKIDPNNGTVTVSQSLDRETANWHNVTVVAKETRQNYLSSTVAVFIKVLDVNDNVPRLATDYRPYICEGTQAGELIQMLSAVDPDDPAEGHHFYFSMVPATHINPNFTIRDNQDNTAGVMTRRSSFTVKDRTRYLLPVVVADSGTPALTATGTLTISVCACQPAGRCPSAGGGVETLALSMGTSLTALLALLVCLATLTALSILTLAMRRRRLRRKQQGASGLGEDEEEPDPPGRVSQKVLRYGEPRATGPGLGSKPVPLRPHPRRRERRLRREDVRASIRMSLRHSHLIGPDDEVFRQFILDRLAEADQDPCVPPFDCLRIYAFEGAGSDAGSLSSLDSCGFEDGSEQPIGSARPYLVQLTPWYGSEEDTF